MLRSTPVCFLCSKSPAVVFCPCTSPEAHFCNSCISLHTSHYRPVHTPLPLAAFGPHRSPQYFPQLQARKSNIAAGKASLLSNIREVDSCIAKVQADVNTFAKRLWEYAQSRIQELEKVREQLLIEAAAAVEEAEKTVYEETPELKCDLSEALRTGKQVELFQWDVTVDADLQSLLRLNYNTLGVTEDLCIPQVHLSSLTSIHLRTSQSTALTLSSTFPYGFVSCVLPQQSLIVVGGGAPPSTEAAVINFNSGRISQEQPMAIARCFPGIVLVAKHVYIFGGAGENSEIQQCEKWSVTGKTWTEVGSMERGRSRFTPCVSMGFIYCPEVGPGPLYLERLEIATERFALTSIALPDIDASPSVSVIVDQELFIVTSDRKLWRRSLTTESQFRCKHVAAKDNNTAPSSLSPVTISGLFVYWVRAYDGGLVRLNLNSSRLVDE